MFWDVLEMCCLATAQEDEAITMVVVMAEAVLPARAMEVWRQLHICSSAQGTQGDAGARRGMGRSGQPPETERPQMTSK